LAVNDVVLFWESIAPRTATNSNKKRSSTLQNPLVILDFEQGRFIALETFKFSPFFAFAEVSGTRERRLNLPKPPRLKNHRLRRQLSLYLPLK
jgi:hypothetical protein